MLALVATAVGLHAASRHPEAGPAPVPAKRISPPRDDAAPAGALAVERRDDRLVFLRSGTPAGEYVFRDPSILRPYMANLRAPDGTPVTRTHPPVPGTDATDHDTMHPGLWLAFGDLGGADFWRNRGRIEHVRFVREPAADAGEVRFATRSRLLRPDGTELGSLLLHIAWAEQPGAATVVWDATFTAGTAGFAFGDQEEMGFGARVATPFAEKNGGAILSSTGDRSAAGTWGRAYDWCDYSGTRGERRSGITLMADPGNFRPSWWHNRDYGVFVANPFGREAMKQGARSAVPVPPGGTLRLRFGAVLHSSPADAPADPAGHFRRFAAGRVPAPAEPGQP